MLRENENTVPDGMLPFHKSMETDFFHSLFLGFIEARREVRL